MELRKGKKLSLFLKKIFILVALDLSFGSWDLC